MADISSEPHFSDRETRPVSCPWRLCWVRVEAAPCASALAWHTGRARHPGGRDARRGRDTAVRPSLSPLDRRSRAGGRRDTRPRRRPESGSRVTYTRSVALASPSLFRARWAAPARADRLRRPPGDLGARTRRPRGSCRGRLLRPPDRFPYPRGDLRPGRVRVAGDGALPAGGRSRRAVPAADAPDRFRMLTVAAAAGAGSLLIAVVVVALEIGLPWQWPGPRIYSFRPWALSSASARPSCGWPAAGRAAAWCSSWARCCWPRRSWSASFCSVRPNASRSSGTARP